MTRTERLDDALFLDFARRAHRVASAVERRRPGLEVQLEPAIGRNSAAGTYAGFDVGALLGDGFRETTLSAWMTSTTIARRLLALADALAEDQAEGGRLSADAGMPTGSNRVASLHVRT